MYLKEAKNYQLINQMGRSHDLYNPSLGEKHPMRVYGSFDLLVDGEVTQSPEDFWIVMNDVDGTSFAQPISGRILAEKLMTGLVPVKHSKVRCIENENKLIYANENKVKSPGGWILDYNYLLSVQKAVGNVDVSIDLEELEAILLVANGESELI